MHLPHPSTFPLQYNKNPYEIDNASMINYSSY